MPARHDRRWVRIRPILLLTAAVAGLLVVARAATPPPLGDVLEIPRRGDVRPRLLADGTPVFASHLADGTVLVIEAAVPALDSPVGELAGWCPRTLQLIAPHHGAVFDARGRRYPIGIRGRGGPGSLVVPGDEPALDLVTRQVEHLPGREDPDDPVRVGARESVLASRGAPRPDPLRDRRARPPRWCRAEPLAHVPLNEPDPVPAERRMRHHGTFAGPLAPAVSRDGWHLVDAVVERSPDGDVRLCAPPDSDLAAGPPPGCAASLVPVTALTAAPVTGLPTWLAGPLRLRVSGGHVTGVQVTPGTVWRGAGFAGTETHRGRFAGFRLGDGRLVVLPPPGDELLFQGGEPCYDPAVLWQGIPVDVDALVDVAGVEDPAGLATLPRGEDSPAVEVVVDRSTCRAMAVRAAT